MACFKKAIAASEFEIVASVISGHLPTAYILAANLLTTRISILA